MLLAVQTLCGSVLSEERLGQAVANEYEWGCDSPRTRDYSIVIFCDLLIWESLEMRSQYMPLGY